jgi:hypothetical protein
MAYEFENRPHSWRSWNYRDDRIDTYIAERRSAALQPSGNNQSDRLQ